MLNIIYNIKSCNFRDLHHLLPIIFKNQLRPFYKHMINNSFEANKKIPLITV